MKSTLANDKETIEKIGQRIKNIRVSMNKSMDEFSAGLNITKSHLWKIENGYIRPSLEPLINLHDKFGVDLNSLLSLSAETDDQFLVTMNHIKSCSAEDKLELYTCLKNYLVSHDEKELSAKKIL